MDVKVGLWRKLRAEESMLLNCGFGECSWESLDCKEIKPVHITGNQSWIVIGRTDAETPILWLSDVKNWLFGKDPDAGKDWRQEEKGSTEDEMARWHHWLDGHKFEQAPEVSDGQGSLACYSPCGSKDSGMTELLFSLTDVFRLSVTSFWVFFLFFLSTSSNNSDISFVVSVLLLFSTSVLGHCSKKMITTEFI